VSPGSWYQPSLIRSGYSGVSQKSWFWPSVVPRHVVGSGAVNSKPGAYEEKSAVATPADGTAPRGKSWPYDISW
jgi:hypothetical protein